MILACNVEDGQSHGKECLEIPQKVHILTSLIFFTISILIFIKLTILRYLHFPGTTILEGIEKIVSPETKVVYKATPSKGDAKDKGYEYAIVVVGEQPYAEFDGDNQNLTIPAPYPELIKDTCSHVACVVVMISGRPLVVEPFVDYMDAFVAAWLPGTEGDGIAEVLFGNYDFQGKLSRTWFKTVDQLPMNVGDKHYDPLYPFGFGLTMGLKS